MSMVSGSDLTDEQKAKIQAWADEGVSLGEIQKRLGEEFELKVTFLDTRLLIAELGISLKEEDKKTVEEDADGTPEAGAGEKAPGAGMPADADADGLGQGGGSGAVTVTMSEVTPPGAMAAGKVTFSDGVTADWSFDQTGRLSLSPPNPEYRPSDADVMAFQDELQKLAQGM